METKKPIEKKLNDFINKAQDEGITDKQDIKGIKGNKSNKDTQLNKGTKSIKDIKGTQENKGIKEIKGIKGRPLIHNREGAGRGLAEGLTRRTVILKDEHFDKLKDIAYWERITIKDLLAEALEDYLKTKKIKSKDKR
jgi:hypothetical protein